MSLDPRSVIAKRRYRHVKTGVYYNVLCRANMEKDKSPVVVYQKTKNKEQVANKRRSIGRQIWIRPLAEFCDGRFVIAGKFDTN